MTYRERLLADYDTHLAAIDELVTRAKEDGDRDLTADEDSESTQHQEAAEKLLPQVERWNKLEQTKASGVQLRNRLQINSGSARVESPTGKPVEFDDIDPEIVKRQLRRIHSTAGHFLHDQVIARQKGDVAAQERIQRALALQTTAQTPGLLPDPFVGDVIGRITAVRPLINNSTLVPLPASGMTWKRPKITQHTLVGVQATEKTEVASRALIVGSLDADFATLAGAVNMSIQEIERSDPSALDLVFADLAAQYGLASEQFAIAALSDGTAGSPSVPLGPTPTADEIRGALYEASGIIYNATSGLFPNVIFAAMDQWALLGQYARAVNPQDRDVLSSPDSLQLNVAGIPVVAVPSLWAGALIVARSDYFEVAERPGSPVELRALEVGILGYEVGVYGMIGALVTEEDAFVNLGVAGS